MLDLIIQGLNHILEIVFCLLVHSLVRQQLNSLVKELVGWIILIARLILLRHKKLHSLSNNLFKLLDVHVVFIIVQESSIKRVFVSVVIFNMHESFHFLHLIVVLAGILLTNEVHVVLSALLLLLK